MQQPLNMAPSNYPPPAKSRKEIDFPYVASLGSNAVVNPGGVIEPEKPATSVTEEQKNN